MKYDREEYSVSNCLQFLAETDEPLAFLKARVKFLEYSIKVQKSMAFLNASGTGQERENKALVTDEYLKTLDELNQAVEAYETLSAQRETRVLHIEVWRSQNANRRVGNV